MALNFLPLIFVLENSDEDFDTFLEAARATGLKNEILRAVSGGECLAFLQKISDGSARRPAFILMDLNTDGIDGREVLATIKTDSGLKGLPVVVFSTSANSKDQAFCYQAGANAYHVKPIRYDDHICLLQSLFRYWLDSVALPNNSMDVA